jgi:transposase-like protein
VAADLATITRRGGRLLWSAPDLGPPGPYAVLFHDPNRALRKRWRRLLREDAGGDGVADPVREAVRRARESMDPRSMHEADVRAARRVLPQANAAEDVARAVAEHFSRGPRLELPTHELQNEDVVETLLVPSNQAEYLPEIPERALRESVIRELMVGQVLPTLQDGPAGTALGLNVQWALGSASL